MEGPTISDGELDILSTQSTGLVSSLASTLGDAVSGVPSRAPGTSNDCFYECASRDSDLSPSDVSDSPILRSPSGSNHGISVSDNETSDDLEITDTAAKFDDLAIAAFGQDGKSVDEGQSVEDYVSEEDYSDDNEEGATGYRKGGYHPVRIGEVYNGRYRVEEKLGWGHFSTVWLCLDLDAHNCVAMKVQKSASHYTEAALDEIELLNKLKMANPEHSSFTVELIDSFFHYGPNGKRNSFFMFGSLDSP